MSELIISHLKKAILTLEEALNASLKKPEDKLYRDATIQRFEYTYELSCKMLRRYLSHFSDSPENIKVMTFPELIRAAWKQKLLKSSWNIWYSFRDARNKSNHAYEENLAKQVYVKIPKFLEEASYLYDQMEKKLQ
ncbi:MAG: nucleotidyltransferase substrate binding protein [Proteobacteria bacterium]|nr:nucleotidyltransferase substrate binding protein [Pseudomonadota bacterium]